MTISTGLFDIWAQEMDTIDGVKSDVDISPVITFNTDANRELCNSFVGCGE